MFKTVSYNDLSSYLTSHAQNEEGAQQFLNLCEDFVKNGGNLMHPVKYSDYKEELKNIEVYLREDIKNIEAIKTLIDKKFIDNYLKIKWENKSIVFHPLVDINFIRNHFSFYELLLKKEFKIFFEETKLIDIKDTYEEHRKKNHNSHTIRNFLDLLDRPDIYELAFSINPSLASLWSVDNDDDEGQRYRNLFRYKNSAQKSYIFYKYAIADKYFLKPENHEDLYYLITHAIFVNDLEFIKTHYKSWKNINFDNIAIENGRPLLLEFTNSNEMTDLLLSLNFSSISNTITDDKENKIINALTPRMNENQLFYILDNYPDIKEKFLKHADDLHKSLFSEYQDSLSIEAIKNLIEKYDYPIDNKDFFFIFSKKINLDKKEEVIENIKWLIEHGADPRDSDKFITHLIDARENGLSILKKLHKQEILLSNVPNIAYLLIQKSSTKPFISWIEAIEPDLTKKTSWGEPVWWAIPTLKEGSNYFKLFKKQGVDFNQKNSKGNTWLMNQYDTFSRERISDCISSVIKYIGSNPIDITSCNHDGENMFNLMFATKENGRRVYKSIYSIHDEIKLLFEYSNINPKDVSNMLLNKNNKNVYAIEKMLEDGHAFMSNKSLLINYIIKFCAEALPYFYELSNKKTIKQNLLDNEFISNGTKTIIGEMALIEFKRNLNDNVPHSGPSKPSLKI